MERTSQSQIVPIDRSDVISNYVGTYVRVALYLGAIVLMFDSAFVILPRGLHEGPNELRLIGGMLILATTGAWGAVSGRPLVRSLELERTEVE